MKPRNTPRTPVVEHRPIRPHFTPTASPSPSPAAPQAPPLEPVAAPTVAAPTIPKPTKPPRPAPPKPRSTPGERPARELKPPPKQIIFGYGIGWVYAHVHRHLCNFMDKYREGEGRFYRVNVPGRGWCYWFVLPDEGQGVDPQLFEDIREFMKLKNLELPQPFDPSIVVQK